MKWDSGFTIQSRGNGVMSKMATLEWLTLAQENVRSIIEESDMELITPTDLQHLERMYRRLGDIDRRARDKFRKFVEDMMEEMP